MGLTWVLLLLLGYLPAASTSLARSLYFLSQSIIPDVAGNNTVQLLLSNESSKIPSNPTLPNAPLSATSSPMLIDDDSIFQTEAFYHRDDEDISSLPSTFFDEVNQLATTKPSILHLKPYTKPLMKLFKKFKFKGIGFTFIKSLIQWNTFGFGLRIPITPHFPEYDRILALPRVSSFVGLYYPLDWRASVSMSLPLQIALLGLVIFGNNIGILNQKLIEKIKNTRASDSSKRVGVTLTFRYYRDKGLRVSIGPWMYYLPGMEVMDRVLPVVFTIPTLITFLLNIFMHIDPSILFQKDIASGLLEEIYFTENEINNDIIPVNSVDGISPESSRLAVIGQHKEQVTSKELEAKILQNQSSNTINRPTVQLTHDTSERGTSREVSHAREQENIYSIEEKLEIKIKKIRKMKSLNYWHNAYLKWAATKTTGLGMNMGWYKSHVDATMGSSVLFDIQPFYTDLPDSLKLYTLKMYNLYNRIANHLNPATHGTKTNEQN